MTITCPHCHTEVAPHPTDHCGHCFKYLGAPALPLGQPPSAWVEYYKIMFIGMRGFA